MGSGDWHMAPLGRTMILPTTLTLHGRVISTVPEEPPGFSKKKGIDPVTSSHRIPRFSHSFP